METVLLLMVIAAVVAVFVWLGRALGDPWPPGSLPNAMPQGEGTSSPLPNPLPQGEGVQNPPPLSEGVLVPSPWGGGLGRGPSSPGKANPTAPSARHWAKRTT